MAMATPYIDPYAILGLTRSATPAQIKQAYFALVRAHPPEREPETFKRIRAAYERLRDPERRAETDMLLLTAWAGPARQRRAPQLDLALHAEDVLAAARALSDLERHDWREHFAKVQL
jgi:curved DNA-binding protein CbpA